MVVSLSNGRKKRIVQVATEVLGDEVSGIQIGGEDTGAGSFEKFSQQVQTEVARLLEKSVLVQEVSGMEVIQKENIQLLLQTAIDNIQR